MKKYLIAISSRVLTTGLLAAFGAVTVAAPVLAATSVSFAPVSANARQGQTFILTIAVNPQGVKNYTAKMELRYPADLLEIKSFVFANGWTPLSQPGYDLIDNTSGTLIKTAGYPGGISSPAAFGTVSFFAKKSGSGAIILDSNSFALDANNQNVLAGASFQTAVTISAPTPVSAPAVSKPILKTPAAKTAKEETVSREKTPAVSEPAMASQSISPRSMLAAVGSVVTLGADSGVVGLLVITIIFALIVYAILKIKKRSNTKH